MDNRPQFEFLLNSIRRKKRWSKWIKSENSEMLDLVCEYYQCNQTVGREYLSILNEEQKLHIKNSFDKGGATS